MTSISGAAALSLFGVKADAQRMAALAAAAKAAEVAKAEVSKVAATKAASGSAAAPGDGKWRDPYADYQAESARKLTEALAYEANEDKFEAENGFRRKVTSSLAGSYAVAKSGQHGGANLSSREEALGMALSEVNSLQSKTDFVNTAKFRMETVTYASWVDRFGENQAKILKAERLDEIESAKMEIVIYSNYLKKSLQIDNGQFVTENSGQYRINASNFSYAGKPLMSLAEDGTITIYDNQGSEHPRDAWKQLVLEQRI